MSDERRNVVEGYDSRRWTGDPTIVSEPKKGRRLELADVSWPLRVLIIVGWIVFFGGLLGNGYCQHEWFYASASSPRGLLTVPWNLKGGYKFISPADERICKLSNDCTIGGAGAFFLLVGFAHIVVFRRRGAFSVQNS